MFKNFARVGSAAAVAAALIGGSLFAAPAANAATTAHKISTGFTISTEKIKVGSHTDTLTIKATSKKAVKAFSLNGETDYAAKSYKLTLKHGKKVLYTKTNVSTFRAIAPEVDVYTVKTFKTDSALTKFIRKDVKLSAAKAKARFLAIEYKAYTETLAYFSASEFVYEVQAYIKENPTATDFSNLGFKTTDTIDGTTYAITGTPQAYTVSAVVKAGGYKSSGSYSSSTKKYTYSAGWVHLYENGVKLV